MLSDLPKWVMPTAIFAVFALLALAYLWLNRDDEDDEDEDEDDVGLDGRTMTLGGSHAADTMDLPGGDELVARKSRMMALKDSLDRSLQTRSGTRAADVDRLALPWFMLVGTEGSGKKSLLANTGLPLPYGPPVELDHSRRDGGRWWMFEQAVVVEAPTVKPAPKPATPTETTASEPALQVDVSESWNNLLHLLQRERPDSPLNGVVVAVSCADLIGSRRKSPEEIAEQAALVRAFLDRTRRVLGVRLPVHVLITRCDVIPGFRSFTETLPEPRRNDIFGWSNPHALEAPYDAAWAEEGMADVRRSLESLHDEMLAAPEVLQDADGLFVFVNEFAEIHDPLVDYLNRLFPAGERRPSFFFRGFSFTGDSSEQAARAAAMAEDDNATLHISMEATDAEAHSLVFMQQLFAEKVFREAGLARTASRIRLSRDPRVVLAQAAAVIIGVLGIFGMWSAINGVQVGERLNVVGLRTVAHDLTRTLVGTAVDVDELQRTRREPVVDSESVRRAQDAALINLVSEMGAVSSSRLRSRFIPSSWGSSLPKDIHESMRQALQVVVLPVARQRLQERVDRTLGQSAGAAARDDLDPADPKSLVTYLADVKELNRNVSRYNTLANGDSGTTVALAELMDYLFGERPDSTALANEEFNDAVRLAQAPRLTLTPAQSRTAVSRATELVITVTDSASRQLSPAGAVRGNDVRALRRLKALSDLLDPRTGLIATVSDSVIAGTRLARAVQDSITKYLDASATRVLRDPALPDQAGQRLRGALAALFEYRFMEPAEHRAIVTEIPAGRKLRWDVGRLELAISFRADVRRALAATGEAFAPATQARLRTALEEQMRDRMIDVVSTSQLLTRDSAGSGAVRAEAENLDLATARLLHVAALLDSLKAGDVGQRVLRAAARQAEHVIALGQATIDSARHLTPRAEVVAQWRGGIPVGFAALGVTDEATRDVSLRDQGNELATLAAEAGPALRYLSLPQVRGEVRARKLVNDWNAMTQSLAMYSAQDVKSTRFTFEQYVLTTMTPIDLGGCQRIAAQADTVRAAADFFLRRRAAFRAVAVGRCTPDGSRAAAAAYERLRSVFNARLAGHFPFVDSVATGGKDAAAAKVFADPAAVREFYALYDAFARFDEFALRSDPRYRPGGAQAFVFLDRVAQARPFFAAFIDSGAVRAVPEYAFAIAPISAGTPGEYRLLAGERALALDDSTRSGAWTFGEPVRIVLDTARQAPPRFASAGGWGLVELAARSRETRVRIYHPDTMLELKLPAFPSAAPALPPRGNP